MISAPIITFKKHAGAVLLLALFAVLSACGIKPGDVSPPEGYDNSKFPHTYPDPSTDPEP